MGSEAICTLLDSALIIEPVAPHVAGGKVSELILAELIEEGYQGDALLAEFKNRRAEKCGK